MCGWFDWVGVIQGTWRNRALSSQEAEFEITVGDDSQKNDPRLH